MNGNMYIFDCEPTNSWLQTEASCMCALFRRNRGGQGNCDSPVCPNAVCYSNSVSCICWGYSGGIQGKQLGLTGNGACSTTCPAPNGTNWF
jgi:hypothetical protein